MVDCSSALICRMLNVESGMLNVQKSSDRQISSASRFTPHFDASSDSKNSTFTIRHSKCRFTPRLQVLAGWLSNEAYRNRCASCLRSRLKEILHACLQKC